MPSAKSISEYNHSGRPPVASVSRLALGMGAVHIMEGRQVKSPQTVDGIEYREHREGWTDSQSYCDLCGIELTSQNWWISETGSICTGCLKDIKDGLK